MFHVPLHDGCVLRCTASSATHNQAYYRCTPFATVVCVWPQPEYLCLRSHSFSQHPFSSCPMIITIDEGDRSSIPSTWTESSRNTFLAIAYLFFQPISIPCSFFLY